MRATINAANIAKSRRQILILIVARFSPRLSRYTQRWIVARLRNRRFFSLAELNAAIRELVDRLNNRVNRHLGARRAIAFDR